MLAAGSAAGGSAPACATIALPSRPPTRQVSPQQAAPGAMHEGSSRPMSQVLGQRAVCINHLNGRSTSPRPVSHPPQLLHRVAADVGLCQVVDRLEQHAGTVHCQGGGGA